mmetsp:Transcript_7200/g.29059  ORF Transcript_7200/g.29059 Transcript_7200/m.29059 type:complete len:292 (+) Transcript_7200:322-1197(+)
MPRKKLIKPSLTQFVVPEAFPHVITQRVIHPHALFHGWIPALALAILFEYPRLDQRPSTDHHRSHSRVLHSIARIVPRQHVAVAYDWNVSFPNDVSNHVVIRRLGVPLLLRPTVHDDGARPRIFQPLRDSPRLRRRIDPESNLHRQRHVDPTRDPLHQPLQFRRLFQQRRAEPALPRLVNRTSAIQVHEIRAKLPRRDQRRVHALLNGVRRDLRPETIASVALVSPHPRAFHPRPLREKSRERHLAHHDLRPEFARAQPSERRVSSLRQRRQPQLSARDALAERFVAAAVS